MQEFKENYLNQNERMNPQLENMLKSNLSDLAKNPAFPKTDANGNPINFLELIAYKRFLEVIEKVKRYTNLPNVTGGGLGQLNSFLMQGVQFIQQVEAPHKLQLENLAVDLVVNEMEIPDGVFQFQCKLVPVGSINQDGFQKEVEEPKAEEVNKAFENESQELEIPADELFEDEKYKRRFINMLIQGSSKKGHYMFELVRRKINEYNPNLAETYGKVMSINDLIYWLLDDNTIKQMASNPSVMGGKEEIEESEDGSIIKTEAICFPISLHEIIKGVMEVFGTQGLPDDPQQAQLVINAVDSLSNETMDLRLGAIVWEKFVNAYPNMIFEEGNRYLQHYLFSRFCALPTDEFFRVSRLIMSDDPKGAKYFAKMVDEIQNDLQREDYEKNIDDINLDDLLGYKNGGKVSKGYNVFNYTDNVYATDEVFKTKKLANEFIKEFRNRFSRQGYYRDNQMNKIAIEDIDLLAIPSDFSPFRKFNNGGMIDLFEDYENIPANVKSILDDYELEESDYDTLNDLQNELADVGYTFDFGLDYQPYGLRPIGVKITELQGYEDFDDSNKFDGGGEAEFDVYNWDDKMALINLGQIYEYAIELDKIINEDTDLEEWVKMKLTRIEQNISDVKHSLEGWEKYSSGGEIAKKQLLHIAKYSKDLIEMISNGSKLMSWQEGKLSVSAQSIDDIYHHLDYKMGNRAVDLENESEDEYGRGGRPIKREKVLKVRARGGYSLDDFSPLLEYYDQVVSYKKVGKLELQQIVGKNGVENEFEFKTEADRDYWFDVLSKEQETYFTVKNKKKYVKFVLDNLGNYSEEAEDNDLKTLSEKLDYFVDDLDYDLRLHTTREDFIYYLDLKDKYADGGIIEVVGKGNKGAFRKREYEGMTEKEVADFWLERGYTLSKSRSESKLKPYTFYIQKYDDGGGVGEFPPKGELTNKDNFLLKYEKKGGEYEFFVYKPITKEISGYNQIKHVCLNKDCPQKMNYEQFINYLYSELYLDDTQYADGGGVEDWMKSALYQLQAQEDNDNLQISYVNDNEFTCQDDDSNEYRVFKNEGIAEEVAVEEVESDISYQPENFNRDFLMDYIEVGDFFVDDFENSNYDYVKEIENESDENYPNRLIAELVDNGLITEKEGLTIDPTELSDEYSQDYIDLLNADQIGNDNGVQYFIDNFGEDEFFKIVIDNDLIDFDEASQNAVNMDGIAHFLARYDGETIYLDNNVVAYRTN